MKKLRLDVDALAVQTFVTDATAGKGKGTVRGHNPSNHFTLCWTQQGATCEPAHTCPECAYTLTPCAETDTCP